MIYQNIYRLILFFYDGDQQQKLKQLNLKKMYFIHLYKLIDSKMHL